MNRRTPYTCDQSVEKATVFPTACPSRAPREQDPLHGYNTAEKQRHRPIGTRRAVNSSPSVASSPARCWGGKRNNASRTSNSLSLSQAANIIEAAQFAAAAGMAFNRHLTIHWQQAGVPDEQAAWATGRFLKLAGDWIAKRGGLELNQEQSSSFAWVWVRENGERKGSHVHILLHLPAGTQIGAMQRRWLRAVTDLPYSASTIKTTRIGGTAGAAESAPAAFQTNLAAVVGYILKGTSPNVARELGLERREAGGRIVGKRAATSQNIGRSARAKPVR